MSTPDPIGNAERLARAVLLFHSSHVWTPAAQAEWLELTGSRDCTTRELCNLARRIRWAPENEAKR